MPLHYVPIYIATYNGTKMVQLYMTMTACIYIYIDSPRANASVDRRELCHFKQHVDPIFNCTAVHLAAWVSDS